MFCTKCGNENSEGSRFCNCCGSELNSNYAESYVAQNSDVELEQQEPFFEATSDKKTKKGKAKLLWAILIPVIAVILIAGITVTAVVAPYYGPMTNIVKAVDKTVNAESFSFKVKTETKDDEGIDLKGSVILDFAKKDITMYCNLTVEGTRTESEATEYGYESKEVEYADNRFFGIYDGKLFAGDADTGEVHNVVDISDTVEICFETYAERGDYVNTKGFDYDKLFDKISDVTGRDIDRDDIEDYVDLDMLNDSFKTAWKSLNDKKWLEENLNYEKDRNDGVTYYSFEPDYKDLARSAKDIFSDAIVDDDLKDLFEDGIDDIADDLKDNDIFDIEADIGIKKGYLYEATFKNSKVKAKIEFGNIGSAKLNEKQLQEYIDSAE